ncbi:MAG: secretin N-terminal domain-containing protein, partial [Halioglobus sp.]
MKTKIFSGKPRSLLLKWPAFALAVTPLLVSCATVEPVESVGQPVIAKQESTVDVPSASAPEGSTLSSSAADLAQSSATEGRAKPILYKGNDELVKMPPVAKPIKFVGDDVSINFEQAPLNEVMHAIMGDILGLDYLVDHPVKGQVTMRSRTPIPRDQLLGVLESLLQANDALMVRGSDGRYLITGSKQGSKISPSLSNVSDLGAGYSISVIPLRYISAANMAEILKPVADPSAFVRVDNSRNLLMLAGTRAQHQGWQDMVATFDVDMLKGMSVGLFPLEN